MKPYALFLVALPALAAHQAPSTNTFKLMLDTQAVAPQGTTPPPSQSAQDQPPATSTATLPADASPAHQPTLLDELHPSDNALSQANIELLAKNAALSRQVDDLTVQLGVLTEERSGQLFFYGAMTSFASLLMGFVLAKILERQRWR